MAILPKQKTLNLLHVNQNESVMKKIVVDPNLPIVVVLIERNTFLYAHDVEKLCKGTVLIADHSDKGETVMTALQEAVSSLKKKQTKRGFLLRFFKIFIKTVRRYR